VLAQTLSIDGSRVPRFFYGTAWKEEATQSLVELAIEQGFRAIDTANQRRHYHEAAVGLAIAAAIDRGSVTRDELFLQTKFTFRAGQDDRLPYDPGAPIADQVAQSLASSREHLGTETIDAYVLHGPSQSRGLGPADWQAWRAMEAAHDSGQVRLLGVSNVDAEQLQLLCEQANVRPRFVQNRCFARTGWDRAIREFCAANQIIYQGFSLLTANQQLLLHPDLIAIARRHGRSVQQIIFRFALDVGMIPLTGTTDPQHMRADLDVFDFQLAPEEVQRIEMVGVSNA
jgi:diketogulonate reductase-like aldo/keto reductase